MFRPGEQLSIGFDATDPASQHQEDISSYEKKLRAYLINSIAQRKEFELIHNHEDTARGVAGLINEKYGEDLATVEPSQYAPIRYYVRVKQQDFDLYKDILDEHGKLLPSQEDLKTAA